MTIITKEDIIKAFKNKNRQRNLLLYRFYSNEIFNQGFTSKFIAEKISEDLGITITTSIIEMIKHRIIKKQKSVPASLPSAPFSSAATTTFDPVTTPQEKGENNKPPVRKVQETKKEEEEYDFYATDTTPKENPFKKALEGL